MNTPARSYTNVDALLSGGGDSTSCPWPRACSCLAIVSYVRGAQSGDPAIGIEAARSRDAGAARARAGAIRRRTWFLVAEEVVTADQGRVDADLGETPTPGPPSPTVGRSPVACGVDDRRVTNVFDRLYVDALSYQRDPFRTGVRLPEPGRQWFSNVSWRF